MVGSLGQEKARREAALLDLVLQVHRAASEPELWPQTLAAIRFELQGTFSSLLCFDESGALALPALDLSAPEDLLLEYSREWADKDDLFQRAVARGPRQVTRSDEILAGGVALRSAVWNEFYLPRDLSPFVAATPDPGSGATAMMVVYRGADQRPFERRELQGVERLLPHVSSSLRTYLDLHEAFAFRSALGEALEVLPLAVILLDGQGSSFVNAAARRVSTIATGSSWSVGSSGRLDARKRRLSVG